MAENDIKEPKTLRAAMGRNHGLMLFLAFSYGDLTKDLVSLKELIEAKRSL